MTLRGKLLLAQVPLALALAVVGGLSVFTISSLGRHSEAILEDNYRSVLAAERMKDALERLQIGAADRMIPGATTVAPAEAAEARRRFDAELAVEEGNITEVGEREAAQRLHQLWDTYRQQWDRLAAIGDTSQARQFFVAELEPSFHAVRKAAETILLMNQDAMVRKSERARRQAERMNTVMVLAFLCALLLGVVASAMTTNRLLQPLALLTATVHRIGEGDFEARVDIPGRDELAQLAANVNLMLTRLGQYRRSSLGELLLAQHASQAAIDSIPDPVIVFDAKGDVLSSNQAAETLLGLRLEAGRQGPLDLVEPAVRAAIEKVRAHVLAGKGPYVPKGLEESLRLGATDSERYFLPRATAVYSEEGAIDGAAVILQDVTRLRRVDELRNDLVATVAHEFRTPLTSLRMAIHLCLEQIAGPVTEKQADLLYAARDDCERLQSIVDELLDLAKIQGGRVELNRRPTAPAILADMAVDAHRAAADERQIVLQTEVPPGLPEIAVDRERLQVALSNLVGNALRHTPPGGAVTLRASSTDEAIRFEVADTGPGIAKEYQASIFDRFFRVPGTVSGGVGLGLSIAKEIVEAHGGEIGVDSEPGHGATFWFILPREHIEMEAPTRPA